MIMVVRAFQNGDFPDRDGDLTSHLKAQHLVRPQPPLLFPDGEQSTQI